MGCKVKTRDEWEKAASSLSFDGRAVIAGKRVATEKTSEDISPVTAKSLADVSECGQREVDQAVASSRAAFENGWSTKYSYFKSSNRHLFY